MSTLTEMIDECRREVGMREHVYPARVAAGKMTQAAADKQVAIMIEIADVLERLQENLPLFKKLATEVRILKECPEAQVVLDHFPGTEMQERLL
jgi:hypothetical protein